MGYYSFMPKKKERTSSEPRTLQEAIIYFADEDRALEYVVSRRWPDGVKCPHCGESKVYYLKSQRRWKCSRSHKRRQFTAKVGTIFEDSPLPFSKWLPAVWMVANCKNGVSSYEIHRALDVTQKSAWFMLQRIRLAMQSGGFDKMSGEVEADEPGMPYSKLVELVYGERSRKAKKRLHAQINQLKAQGRVRIMPGHPAGVVEVVPQEEDVPNEDTEGDQMEVMMFN